MIQSRLRSPLARALLGSSFAFLAGIGLAALLTPRAEAEGAAGIRAVIEGEVVDSWCASSGIMYAQGSAHHQCAVWCAVGGIPIGILDREGQLTLVLQREGASDNVAEPGLLEIQSQRIRAEGTLIVRDGVRYLLIERVAALQGVVNATHGQWGVQPFGADP